jgi:nitrogen fixation/metabolism regulation signal transduction histidine kinase
VTQGERDDESVAPHAANGGSLRRIASLLLVVLPLVLAWLWFIRGGDQAWALIALAVAMAISVAIAWSMSASLERRLRTISSVLAAYREGDFSIRARSVRSDAILEEVVAELNQLGDVLRSHRLGEMEAWTLLRKVMAEVDVVVVAIDDRGRLRLANEAAARMLGRAPGDLLGASATELGLGDLLDGSVPQIAAVAAFEASPAGGGPWELRRGSFRLAGEQQTLIVLSDVSRALRDNERDAWRRLIRVIGHEINNSLSPIQSISESLLGSLEARRPFANDSQASAEWERDLAGGLGVIGRRAEALSRFMASYAALAKLPPPRLAPVDVRTLVEKIAALETRAPVTVLGGPDVTLKADADQLEQALINLVKNAAEATLSRPTDRSPSAGEGSVRVSWTAEQTSLELAVEDDGPGVSDTANLFVPFFTTKPEGSGIGLVLSRQIVEAHDGRLTLVSRPDGRGAVARIRIPRT